MAPATGSCVLPSKILPLTDWPFIRTGSFMVDSEARIRLHRPVSSLEGNLGGREEGITGTYEWAARLENNVLVLSRKSIYRPAWVDADDVPVQVHDLFRSLMRAD